MTSKTWDGEDRLTRVALPSGIVNTFTYNGDGQRVQKKDSTGTMSQVWDRQNILLESDGGNFIQVVYTLEPANYGNIISQRRGGTSSLYLFDGLGSTRQLTNILGSSTDAYLYDSFGNILLTSGSTTNAFRYVGELGYYYDLDLNSYSVRARYYYPAYGLFFSRDRLADLRLGSLYVYALNRPLSFVDPSGLWVLFCRRLAGLGYLSFQVHCFVSCNGTTYSLLNKGGTATPVINDPADVNQGWVEADGVDECGCIARHFSYESGTYTYDKDDCNSNWFANSLLASCGINVSRPGAYGWSDCTRYTFCPTAGGSW